MGKSPSNNVQIPSDVQRALAAAARATGKSEGEVIVDILIRAFRDHPLSQYTQEGVFDALRFRADLTATADALEQWDLAHWTVVERILKAGKRTRRLAQNR